MSNREYDGPYNELKELLFRLIPAGCNQENLPFRVGHGRGCLCYHDALWEKNAMGAAEGCRGNLSALMYGKGELDRAVRMDAHEEEMLSVSMYLMLVGAARVAEGLACEPEGLDALREPELQKEMIYVRYTLQKG